MTLPRTYYTNPDHLLHDVSPEIIGPARQAAQAARRDGLRDGAAIADAVVAAIVTHLNHGPYVKCGRVLETPDPADIDDEGGTVGFGDVQRLRFQCRRPLGHGGDLHRSWFDRDPQGTITEWVTER